MAAKAAAKKVSVEKGDAVGKKPVCPKCGPGVYMATHKDRVSCGKCGYTEFKKE
jgi:small subunit ribosomal protein S27Ae